MGSHILIVGAGAMGIVTGYFLNLGGSRITFLVRPHRAESLQKPQILYSYDEQKLKTFSDYEFETSPEDALSRTTYDYILITLDGAALLNDIGRTLSKKIGQAIKTTNTAVLLGTIFPNIKTLFSEQSGLPEGRVSLAPLLVHAYSTEAVTLPLHPPTEVSELAKATWAYRDSLGPGIFVDDSSPPRAEQFAKLYDASGLSTCAILPQGHLASTLDLFAVMGALDLMGWPKFSEFDDQDSTWQLGCKAKNEIGRLLQSQQGPQTKTSSSPLSSSSSDDGDNAETTFVTFAGFENKMLPLDFQGFNRYHHGGKVNTQDRKILKTFLDIGKKEGREMPALTRLLEKIVEKKG